MHVGSRRVGGVPYRLLAVFLSYSAIVMTYVPFLASELNASEEFQADRRFKSLFRSEKMQ